MTEAHAPALRLENLGVEYRVKGQSWQVLDDINLEIPRGESYGLVGESGCGKSTAAFAALRYLPRNGFVNRGRVLIDGQDVYGLDRVALRRLRRVSVAMVYQDAGRALNPSIRIGQQVQEVFELAGAPRTEWRSLAEDILARVRISDPLRVMQRYPHQLSGGMQQRVAIAMAIASNPALLVLDEPTTGLDATVEAEVLDLISQLRQELSTSILFISHNLGVIARMCDRVGVLYAGRLVEEGRAGDVFLDPRHPYTAGLLRCLPKAGRSKAVAPLATIPGFLPLPGAIVPGCIFSSRCMLADELCHTASPEFQAIGDRLSKCHYPDRIAELSEGVDALPVIPASNQADQPVLQLRNVSKTFGIGDHQVRAVRGVDLDLGIGETLGIVGESGSGKTTLARTILGLIRPDPGSTIAFAGTPVAADMARRSRAQIKAIQIIFQNPDSALNRSHSVRRMIGRTIDVLVGLRSAEREERIKYLTRSVRLTERHLAALPRQLSGGLKQRVAIARAFASDPQILICDEPTSALDVSVQAAILNLLAELQANKQVSYILISHDLGVVRYLSDRIAVLYLGQLMEVGSAEQVFSGPHHPYTEALLSSVPSIDGKDQGRVKLVGEIPSAARLPTGCVFHTRCPRQLPGICEAAEPPLVTLEAGHVVRCHIPPDQLPRRT
jgi:peptide/nickel transport system ATP-binding protein